MLAQELAPKVAANVGVKVGHYLTRIQAGVAQMGQLIEDLLSLSQVSRAPLHRASINLSLMAQKLLQEWRIREPERKVTATVENGLQAHGDERLVLVVMKNLLANAWKFTGQKAQAEISVGQQPDHAGLPVYFIKDNGAGFDMAYVDKLFPPFQRLHSASEFLGPVSAWPLSAAWSSAMGAAFGLSQRLNVARHFSSHCLDLRHARGISCCLIVYLNGNFDPNEIKFTKMIKITIVTNLNYFKVP